MEASSATISLEELVSDEALKGQLSRLEDVAGKLWRKDSIYHQFFTAHGVTHSRNLIANFTHLIPDAIKHELSEVERALLVSSAWAHDLGMLYIKAGEDPRNDDDVKNIRETHHLRSEEFLLSNKVVELSGIFDERERLALAELCKSHGLSDFASLRSRWIDHVELRMGFLAALLRLADVCDVTYMRDGLLFQILYLDQASLPHWAQLRFIDAVTLDPKGRAFELRIRGRVPAREEALSRRLVETMAVRWIRAEVAQSRTVLAHHGFFITEVIPDLEADSHLDDLPHLDELRDVFEPGGPLYEPDVSAAEGYDELQTAILDSISQRPRGAVALAHSLKVTEKYIENSVRELVELGLVDVSHKRQSLWLSLTPSGHALVRDLGMGLSA